MLECSLSVVVAVNNELYEDHALSHPSLTLYSQVNVGLPRSVFGFTVLTYGETGYCVDEAAWAKADFRLERLVMHAIVSRREYRQSYPRALVTKARRSCA